jgi:hypothetical protein
LLRERGTKYHIAVRADGILVACAATAANVNDTVVFARLFLAAFRHRPHLHRVRRQGI